MISEYGNLQPIMSDDCIVDVVNYFDVFEKVCRMLNADKYIYGDLIAARLTASSRYLFELSEQQR